MNTKAIEKQSDSLELDHPIDYLIFSKTPISVKWEGSAEEVIADIVERVEHTITLRLTPSDKNPQAIESGISATLSCPYHDVKLAFDVILEHANPALNLYICHKPKYGCLVNERINSRARFDSENCGFRAHLTAETVDGTIEFITYKLVDFSLETVSFIIPRAQGLVLPYDMITALKIYQDANIVFEACGEVLRVDNRYNIEGENCFFLVVKLIDPNQRPPIDIHLNERQSRRLDMQDRHDAFIEFVHPFNQSMVISYISDLSNSGMSILIDNETHTLLPGLCINKASLQLPLRPRLSLKLKVMKVSKSKSDDNNLTKVSIAFINPPAFLTKEVSSFVQKSISDKLFDADIQDNNSLWEFYFETNFIYSSKRRQIQEYSESIRQTQKTLLDSKTPLVKNIVYKEYNRPLGNGTALKIYDNTLLLQHLNAKSTHSGTAARAIIRGMTTFFLDVSASHHMHNRYVCTYYRPDNLFPALVFGESSAIIGNPNICWIRDYRFCTLNESFMANASPVEDIQSHEAEEQDIYHLERLLIESKNFNLMRLEGLFREKLFDMAVFAEYKKLGLYRYRRLFVAQNQDNNLCCFAICTYSSPGMNFSELTNSVKFVFNTNKAQEQTSLINAIMPDVLSSYRQSEMHRPVLLLDEGTPIPHGFKQDKVYTLWSMDLNYPELFRDSTEMIFSDIKSFIRNKKVS